MKKVTSFLLMVFTLLLVVGCEMNLTPTKKVEELLGKYERKDESVLSQLEKTIEEAGTMNDSQKDDYRRLMERQYEYIYYKIKEEKIDGNNASVSVEIEVYDYGKAITDAETYLTTNQEEFIDEETKATDPIKFLDYKIKKMQKIEDRITYTINFTLTKKDGKWEIDELSDIDRLKLHGLYY